MLAEILGFSICYCRREGVSITRPLLFDGTNYSYRKARIKAFIKLIDEKAWRSVLVGWSHPTTTDVEKNVIPKPKESWSNEEDHLANNNSKALNSIFNVVDANQFKLISTCKSAKEAWNIRQVAHEGTTAVKQSKLQMLVSRFENLNMHDDECIVDFNSKLYDIANESFALDEKYLETKLVRKILRSFPNRFQAKVTAIE